MTFKNILADLEPCIIIKQWTRLVNEQMQCSEGTEDALGEYDSRGIEIHLRSCSHPLSLGQNNTFGSIWRLDYTLSEVRFIDVAPSDASVS